MWKILNKLGTLIINHFHRINKKLNFNESIQLSIIISLVPSTALSLFEGINKQVDSVQYQLSADCQ